MILVAAHPILETSTFNARYPSRLGELASPEWLRDLLRLDAPAPVERTEETRSAIRDMLRWGGYKPTGRGKPASEYLVRAAGDGTLTSINAAVDVCNAVSLHSGLPISLIDADRTRGALRIEIAPPGTSYVFNATGQDISLGGLLCVFDDEGPCANAVKDSQRTKTNEETVSTVTVIWGAKGLEGVLRVATEWYGELLERLGSA